MIFYCEECQGVLFPGDEECPTCKTIVEAQQKQEENEQ